MTTSDTGLLWARQVPFLSSSWQCQSTEGSQSTYLKPCFRAEI